MPNRPRFSALEKVMRDRLALIVKERKLAEHEQRIIREIGRVLPRIGYRLVSVNGPPSQRGGAPRRKRALAKVHKCPKCDRRFSLQMHVARHMSAIHKTRQARKTRPTPKK